MGLLSCLLGFGLLVSTLDSQSIWWDEGISLHLAGLSWREIVRNRATNIHPPLYFFLLKVWTGFAGHSPFTGRYFSALAITLLPAAVYRFLRNRLSHRGAATTALLVALAPPFVVYGQETRAYALLPLGVVALWSCVWPTKQAAKSSGDAGRLPDLRRGLVLGAVQASLMLLHYAGVLAVGVGALGYLYRWIRSDAKHRRNLRSEWLTGALLTVMLVLPWGIIVLAEGLQGLGRQAGLANLIDEPVPASYVAGLLGVFHLYGLPEVLGRGDFVRLLSAVGLLLAGSIGFAVWRSSRWRLVVGLLALWLVPFLAAPLIWTLSPQSHPRYLFAFVVGGWLLVGTVSVLREVPQILRLILVVLILAGEMLGLVAYLGDPHYARSDVRAAAAFVRDAAAAGDLALAPQTDWSLDQYDLGAARFTMVTGGQDPAPGLAGLDAASIAGQRVFALDYDRGALDPQGGVRAALTAGGVLVDQRTFHGVHIEVYEMWGEPRLPECQPVPLICVEERSLCLTGVGLAEAPVSGGAAPVVLCWERRGDIAARYGVAVRLYGPAGDFIVADHDLLLAEGSVPTDAWSDDGVMSYHVLPLPVGALPLAHKVDVSLYDALEPAASVVLVGEDLPGPSVAAAVGQVSPSATEWQDVSLYDLNVPSDPVSNTIEMESAPITVSLDRQMVRSGESLYASLSWRRAADVAADAPSVALYQEGELLDIAVSQATVLCVPPDRPLLETIALSVPETTPSGEAVVDLLASGSRRRVGVLEVEGTDHVFDVPSITYPVDAAAGDVAEFLGFNLNPGPVLSAGDPVTVSLVWRAGAGAAELDLKVFVHLRTVAGETVAQADAQPANWTRPTSGWIADEIVIDAHALTWHTESIEGPARLWVGFYDGVTGERLMWSHGADALELPVELTLVD